MAIGVIWDEIWDEAAWDNAIWSQALAVTPPTLDTASMGTNGTDLTLTFSEALTIGSGGSGGFSLTASGGNTTLTYASGDTTSSFVFNPGRTIGVGENLVVEYTAPGDGLEDATGDDLANFSAGATNNSTQDVTAPTVQSALLNAAGTELTIYCSENVSIGAGGNGGFAITMSGGAATLTYDSISGRSITYTTSRTIATSETGTLAYTQPGNGVEDASGNDMESFSGKVVAFVGSLGHNSALLRHMRPGLKHKDPTDVHNELDLDHNE